LGFLVVFLGFSMTSLGIYRTSRYSAFSVSHKEPSDCQFLRPDINPSDKMLQNALFLFFGTSLVVVKFHEAFFEHSFHQFLRSILFFKRVKPLMNFLDHRLCFLHSYSSDFVGFLWVLHIRLFPVLYPNRTTEFGLKVFYFLAQINLGLPLSHSFVQNLKDWKLQVVFPKLLPTVMPARQLRLRIPCLAPKLHAPLPVVLTSVFRLALGVSMRRQEVVARRTVQ
jgi:hypothetical protein